MKYDAPVPGENLLEDGKNYPWRRPPEIVDYDEAVSLMIENIDEPSEIETIFAMMDIGADVCTITSTLLLTFVQQGRVSIDLAILMAGPISRYIEIQSKGAGVSFKLGLEQDDRRPVTPTQLKMLMGLVRATPEEDLEEPEEEKPTEESIMAMPDVASEDEQAAMLGATVDEEAPVEEVPNEQAPEEEEVV